MEESILKCKKVCFMFQRYFIRAVTKRSGNTFRLSDINPVRLAITEIDHAVSFLSCYLGKQTGPQGTIRRLSVGNRQESARLNLRTYTVFTQVLPFFKDLPDFVAFY